MDRADVVVVGLGAVGAATTFQLARRGITVIGIDRYAPPHAMGSSHGETRITRQGVGEGGSYVPLVLRSHEIWRELEERTQFDILHECGLLLLTANSMQTGTHGVVDFLAATVAAAQRYGIAHEVLSPQLARQRFPQFAFDDNYRCYFEPGAGFVRPERAIQAQLALAGERRAQLNFNETVLSVTQHRSGVVVRTDQGEHAAAQVVLAAGPWIGDLLDDRDLAVSELFRVYRQTQHWFEVGTDHASHTPDRMPVFIWEHGQTSDDLIYGFPAIDGIGGGLKVATEQHHTTTRPDVLDRAVSADESRQTFNTCVRGRLPALRPNPVKAFACMYTTTPDSQFVVDRHPAHDRVFIASACSGHGFKHSAAVGESLAQIIVDGHSIVDLSSFALRRFLDP